MKKLQKHPATAINDPFFFLIFMCRAVPATCQARLSLTRPSHAGNLKYPGSGTARAGDPAWHDSGEPCRAEHAQ